MANRPKVGGFPFLAACLKRAGVERNVWFLPGVQSMYMMQTGVVVNQGTPLVTGMVEVPTFNEQSLITALRTDQAGKSTFAEFLMAAWNAGVVRYEVDFLARTVSYYGAEQNAMLNHIQKLTQALCYTNLIMNPSIFTTVVGIFWFVFILYWLVSAIGVKNNIRTKEWQRYVAIRFGLIIVVIIVLKFTSFLQFQYQFSLGIELLGAVLCIFGQAFAVWARIHLGRNWSGTPSMKEGHELIVSGPYHFVRHPIYTGILLALLGSALTSGILSLVRFLSSSVSIFSIEFQLKKNTCCSFFLIPILSTSNEPRVLFRLFGKRGKLDRIKTDF